MLKKIAYGLIALLACAAVPALAQMWPNFPILNGASYCQSTVNGSCVSTIPAGPSMSGLETIPADTNLAGGGVETVKIPIQLLNGGPYVFSAPTTGDTITLTNVTRQLIIHGSGTFSSLTVVTPAASTLLDGQRLSVCGDQIVTTLTVTAGSGTTVSNAPTAMLVPVATGAASCFGWLYHKADTTWYRVQ